MIEERIVGSIDTVQDLKKLRWLGPPILTVFVLFAIAVDASNGVLTTDGAVISIIFGTPIAASIVEYSRNVRGKRLLGLELNENYNGGPLGTWFVVLFTETIMCGILGSILSLIVGITLAIVSSVVTSVLGIPGLGIDALGITSIFLVGLFLTFIMSDLTGDEEEDTQQSATVERDQDKATQSTQTAADVDQIETSSSDKKLIDEIQNDIDVLEADLVHDNLNRARKCLERADLKLAAVDDSSITEDLSTKKTELRIRLLNSEADSYLQAAHNAVEDGNVELAKKTIEELRDTATELESFENGEAKRWYTSIEALEIDLTAVERELEHRTAVESKLTDAETALDEADLEAAEAALNSVDAQLEDLERNNSDLAAELRSEYATLRNRFETEQTAKYDRSLVGLLGSLGSTRSRIENLIAGEQGEQAIERVERAFDIYDEAEQLNAEHDLGRGDRLEEIQDRLKQLEKEAASILTAEDKKQAQNRYEEFWSGAKRDRSTAESLLDAGEYNAARNATNSGLEHCQEMLDIQDTYSVDPVDTARLQADLKTLGERIEAIQETLETADEQKQTAEQAIKSNDYERASSAVSELEYSIGVLEKHDADQSTVDQLQGTVANLETEIECSRADSSVLGYLGSAASTQKAVEDLLKDGAFERAVQRLEANTESLAEAERLNSEHSLGRGDAITERQETINELLEEAAHKPEKSVREQVAVAEADIERGIAARDADNIKTAVEAFETAVETYEAALTEATEYDLNLQWEIGQRASMATEYLGTTQETLQERKQTVNDDLDQVLDAVESTVVRAEQQMEVGDTVSARESVDEAVADLDDAAKLIETDLATSALMEHYGDLSERVTSLSSNLPEETTGEHRDSDLIDTLQLITRKIGESPRPEFVDAYGEYTAEAYIDSFGSWSEALAVANLDPIDADARERRQYSRKEALDALIELAVELGHLPSRTEMNTRGAMSSTTVANRFTDWDTALELAKDVPAEPNVETDLDGNNKGKTPANSGISNTPKTSDEDDEPSAEDDILNQIEDELGDW